MILTPAPAPSTVLVLGGTGFIGRHAVEALLRSGSAVVIGSRHPDRIGRLVPDLADRCAQRQARLERLTRASDWNDLLEGIDVVLNCVGILRQRGRETYQRVHHAAPAALAQACRERGLRFIHVSALGLRRDARSRFLRSKCDGEVAVRASGADWFIVRPSLLDGDGGYGALWVRRVARWPVHLLPADATGHIAALHVTDLGEALSILARSTGHPADAAERIVELGGLRSWTLAGYVAAIRARSIATPARLLRIPGPIARLGSHLCDLLHATPFSFGHWELLRRDNVPTVNSLPALLGRAPRALDRAEVEDDPSRIGPLRARDEEGMPA